MKALSEKDRSVFAILDDIESEMKLIEFWSQNPPEFKASNFLEAPSFELWLQCIFLPNAREATRNSDYPDRSQVGLMAMRQYDYHSYVEDAQKLVRLLGAFDQLIEGNKNTSNRPVAPKASAKKGRKYTVMVDDNNHYTNESDRYELGPFNSLDRARSAATRIVDKFLKKNKKNVGSENELFDMYCQYGEDPFILTQVSEFKIGTNLA